MKIINPYTEILTPLDGQAILQHIELCGRVCYKSEDKITDTSAAKFVAGIIKRGHEAVLEHFDITVKFVCDRGVSHEIVRHRMASYCQESTRYCNYSKDGFGGEITVIRPFYLVEGTERAGSIGKRLAGPQSAATLSYLIGAAPRKRPVPSCPPASRLRW